MSLASSSPTELVIIVHRDVGLRATAGRFLAKSGNSTDSLAASLSAYGARLQLIFGSTEERILAKQEAQLFSTASQHSETYYRVIAPESSLRELRDQLAASPLVSSSFVKPGVSPPVRTKKAAMDFASVSVAVTPDFSPVQRYLGPSPVGIDAAYAWSLRGGGGEGIHIVDVEGAWRFTHEDLGANQGGVVGGSPTSSLGWRDHGTAVLGTFSADHNGIGVMGICPDAYVSAVSVFGEWGTASAIDFAASRLQAGDVLLIELHRPGPRYNFAEFEDQRGYIPIEWWPDDFLAIRRATQSGIVVVEAGGNGAEDLDHAMYDVPSAGFSAQWRNPFRRGGVDSGAILVGAGAPPPAHGSDYGPDRSRLAFSNYGSLIDAQGWGEAVATSGYGDLQGGVDEDLWYTGAFSGTSSASPIVVGALACMQGRRKAEGLLPLTPAQLRDMLRSTGAAQQSAPGRPNVQRIGSRPNLRELFDAMSAHP
jgi:hypothetical protein